MGAFEAIRRAAAGWMGEEEHLRGIEDGVNSLKARGMLPQSAPARQQPGTNYDTGHYVGSVLGGEDGKWTTYIGHDSDPAHHRIVQIEHGDLGGDHSRLADSLLASLRHPQVMQSMREQMMHGDAEEPRWIRKFEF